MVNVVTGRDMSSLISATFIDESTPPESRTPNGTSATIRRATDFFRRRVSSATASFSLSSFSVNVVDSSGLQSHYCTALASPRWSIVRMYPAGSLKMPLNSVSGAGVMMNVR